MDIALWDDPPMSMAMTNRNRLIGGTDSIYKALFFRPKFQGISPQFIWSNIWYVYVPPVTMDSFLFPVTMEVLSMSSPLKICRWISRKHCRNPWRKRSPWLFPEKNGRLNGDKWWSTSGWNGVQYFFLIYIVIYLYVIYIIWYIYYYIMLYSIVLYYIIYYILYIILYIIYYILYIIYYTLYIIYYILYIIYYIFYILYSIFYILYSILYIIYYILYII